LCPKCLLAAGLDSGQADAIAATQASPAGGFVPPTVDELTPLFPQLDIYELLGKGGMGAVYKARQRELDRLVALKILPPEIGHDAAFAERFTREARALAKLSHPNIVGVYDFGQTKASLGGASRAQPTLFYIVMEFVDGVNLRQALQAGTISPKEALAIVPQICAALQFAHDEGVVHRDIKPENILVDKRGRVKIADFGLAKLLTGDDGDLPAEIAALTGTDQVMGTMRYMAPEQMEATHHVDHRADIYSLGVVFYELLTGDVPQGRFAPPSQKVQIDVRLDEVVLRALEKRPELRWQHAGEVRSQVEAIVGAHDFVPLGAVAASAFGREHKSPRTLFGLPLVHIAFGVDPRTGKRRVAKGIIAIGDAAIGVVSCGSVAAGGVCFGGASVGLLSFGGAAVGLLGALGGAAVGGTAWGGMAAGIVALGGFAAGWFAYGGQAVGVAVMSSSHTNEAGRQFFEPWAHNWTTWMTWLSVALPALYMLLFAWSYWLLRRAERQKSPPQKLAPRRDRPQHPAASGSLPQAETALDLRRLICRGVSLCGGLQLLSAILSVLFLLGVFDDPAKYDSFFDDSEARMLLIAAQGLAFFFGMWSLVGGLALATTGETKMARRGNRALLAPLTPSWLLTFLPTLWLAGLLRDRQDA